MSDYKIVRYNVCNRLCDCSITDVFLCISPSLTVSGGNTIPATIVYVHKELCCCTTKLVTYTHTIKYDADYLIDNYTLTSDDILGVICYDCYAKWVQDMVYDAENCCCIYGNTNTVCGCDTFDPLIYVDAKYNCAFGYEALNDLETGSRNTAIGYQALYRIETVCGDVPEELVEHASDNIGIGYKAAANTRKSYNISIGNMYNWFLYVDEMYEDLIEDCSGYNINSILIGHHNLIVNYLITPNLADIFDASKNNIFIGHANFFYWNNINIGYNNVTIGNYDFSIEYNNYNNVLLGSYNNLNPDPQEQDYGIGDVINTVIVGRLAHACSFNWIPKIITNDVALGSLILVYNFGADPEVCNSNVFIGQNIYTDYINLFDVEKNVLLGADTLLYEDPMFGLNPHSNCICIGYGNICLISNQASIGDNSVHYSDIEETNLRRVLLASGDIAVGSYPLKMETGDLLTVPETGSIEFDGVNLYMTTSAGRQLVV